MKRIVIDARRIRSSTGRYARELLEHLQNIDTENNYHVIIHEKDQGHWAPRNENFFLHVVKYDHYTWGEQIGFVGYLKALRPDLVHFTMPQQPLLYIGKRVTTVHDLTLVRFKNLDKNRFVYAVEQFIFKFLLWNIAKRSIKIITPTKFVKKDIVKYANISEDKVKVTYESAKELAEIEDHEHPLAHGKQYLLYVGNAYPHKNLYRLIEGFKKTQEKHGHLHLIMVGKRDYFYNQIIKHVQENKLTHIHTLGYIDDAELAWLYKHSAAVVFPSLSEGFGLPGLEAMQYERPLISSDATCLPEVYGDAAHYFNPKDSEDIARAIDEVLRSKTRQKKLISEGQKVLEKYSWQKMADETKRVYDSILVASSR